MSRLTRVYQSIFGGSASDNGQFGSAQLGTFNLTNNIATIQALSAWVQGWAAATISGQSLPPLEEMQGIQYVITTQLAYLFQEGIPEWEATTPYYTAGPSIVKKTGTTQLYASLIDNNVGNALPSGVSDGNWSYLGDLANLGALPAQAANTVTVNNTTGSASPVGLAMGASTILARLTSGNIVAATVAQILALLGITIPLTRGTAQTASGSVITFGSLPAGIKRIQVMFSGVTASQNMEVQLSQSATFATSGYNSSYAAMSSIGTLSGSSTAGILTGNGTALSGNMIITNITGNQWVASFSGEESGGSGNIAGGNVTLGGTLDGVRIVVNSSGTFSAGTFNIMYE